MPLESSLIRHDADVTSVKKRSCCGRPPALDDEERRQRILEAASESLKSYGYHAASMDSIASCSGMSKKTLYQFFPSKNSLFETLILERLFTPFDFVTNPSDSLEQQLTDMMTRMADCLLDEERLSLMRSIVTETTRNPAIRQLMTDLFHLSGRKFNVQNWLMDQEKAGLIKVGNPEDASDLLFGITLGAPLLSQLTHCRPPRSREDLLTFIQQGVKVFLAGYRIPQNI